MSGCRERKLPQFLARGRPLQTVASDIASNRSYSVFRMSLLFGDSTAYAEGWLAAMEILVISRHLWQTSVVRPAILSRPP